MLLSCNTSYHSSHTSQIASSSSSVGKSTLPLLSWTKCIHFTHAYHMYRQATMQTEDSFQLLGISTSGSGTPFNPDTHGTPFVSITSGSVDRHTGGRYRRKTQESWSSRGGGAFRLTFQEEQDVYVQERAIVICLTTKGCQ